MSNFKSVLVIVLSVLGGFIGGMIANGQPAWAVKKEEVHKVIRAESFVLVNSKGQERAAFHLLFGIDPRLSFKDHNNQERLDIGIATLDKDGKPRIMMNDIDGIIRSNIDEEGITYRTKGNTTKAYFGIKYDLPQITMTADSNPYDAIKLIIDEGPRLELRENGKTRAVLGSVAIQTAKTTATTKRPASSLVFFDEDEKVLWKAP